MNGIKILLVTGVIFIAVYFFLRLRRSFFDLLLLSLLICAAIVFILFPDITSRLAHRLGVGRGSDLVFYTSIIIFWFVLLKLYVKIRKLEQIITKVVRKDALDESNNKNI